MPLVYANCWRSTNEYCNIAVALRLQLGKACIFILDLKSNDVQSCLVFALFLPCSCLVLASFCLVQICSLVLHCSFLVSCNFFSCRRKSLASTAVWSNVQIAEHYASCIKLSTENVSQIFLLLCKVSCVE